MDTRKQILGAAERLIRSEGLARLTTKRIAQEAGVSEGSLFNHFTRKDDLVLAAIMERVPQLLLSVAKAGDNTVEDNLAGIALAVIRFYEGTLPLLLALFADARLLLRHRESVQQRGGGPQYMLDVVINYLGAEQQIGRVSTAIDPKSVASALCGAGFQWAFVQQSTGQLLWPELTPQAFARNLAANLWLGLVPRSP